MKGICDIEGIGHGRYEFTISRAEVLKLHRVRAEMSKSFKNTFLSRVVFVSLSFTLLDITAVQIDAQTVPEVGLRGGEILLGRPTDSSITINVVADVLNLVPENL